MNQRTARDQPGSPKPSGRPRLRQGIADEATNPYDEQMGQELANRSIRTLAWLGDAVFEQDVRFRVAARGDYPTDRLDTIKAEIVRAEAQALLLAKISARLTESEADVVRRGKNAAPPSSARGRRNIQAYRSSTALEALIAHWTISGQELRYQEVLADPLEEAIDQATRRKGQKIKRG